LGLDDENRIEDFEDDVDLDKTDDISMEYLIKIIQELPDRYRLVFNLYVIDGYSHQEIAEMLNINIGTSKSNLFRARMSLKGKIESDSNIIKSSIK
jgi:RNA polymerase sigma-70 factor (ECF subfamily)